MSENGGEGTSYGESRLRNASDFKERLESVGAEQVRRELNLPDVDEILKDLQQQHGVRVSLSPKLLEKLEEIKARSVSADEATLSFGCTSTDVCIVCDQNDNCETCDTMDWCYSVDTH